VAEFRDVTPTIDGEQLRFRCPQCSREYNWSATQVMNLYDESVADYCDHCGVGMRVWKPNSGGNVPAAPRAPSADNASPDNAAAFSKLHMNELRQSAPATHEFKVLPFIGQSRGTLSASDVAIQLETTIRQQVAQGWEFYQLADVNIEVQPGCLAGLFGAKVQYVRFDQLIFRSRTHQS